MQGIQKIKCSSCGTTFMSEDNVTQCPTCQEQGHGHGGQESSNVGGGCGCGHSH
jgi:Zn finger protein HypA/HybF involved in hydrogenase expression